MLGSITPLGERSRGSRWWLTATWFFAGSTVGGMALGAALSQAGLPLVHTLQLAGRATPTFVLGVAALLGIALDLRLFGLRLAGPRRQVDQRWLTQYRGWVYGVGFGLQLGVGVSTIISTSAVYVAFLAATLSSSLVAGLAIGGVFGLFRATALLSVMGVKDVEALRAVHARLNGLDQSMRAATLSLVGATGLALLSLPVFSIGY